MHVLFPVILFQGMETLIVVWIPSLRPRSLGFSGLLFCFASIVALLVILMVLSCCISLFT